MIITTKETIGNFTAKYPKPKIIAPEKPQLQECKKKNAIIEKKCKKCNQNQKIPSINIF